MKTATLIEALSAFENDLIYFQLTTLFLNVEVHFLSTTKNNELKHFQWLLWHLNMFAGFCWSLWPSGGLFILYTLSAHNCIDTDNIGLYRDYGLLIIKDSSKIKIDRIRKTIHKVLNVLSLSENTYQYQTVDDFDVTLDLNNSFF